MFNNLGSTELVYVAWSFAVVGLVYVFFGWRALRIHRVAPSPLTASFAGYSMLTGVGYILAAPNVIPGLLFKTSQGFDATISIPFFCVGVGYLAKLVWYVMFPSKSDKPIFWFFCMLGVVNAGFSAAQLLGFGNFEVVTKGVSFVLAAATLIVGLVLIRYGTTSKIHRRAMIVGGCLIASGLLGSLITTARPFHLMNAAIFAVLLVAVNAAGLAAIVGSTSKTAKN